LHLNIKVNIICLLNLNYEFLGSGIDGGEIDLQESKGEDELVGGLFWVEEIGVCGMSTGTDLFF